VLINGKHTSLTGLVACPSHFLIKSMGEERGFFIKSKREEGNVLIKSMGEAGS
jgi:hypothetical protein